MLIEALIVVAAAGAAAAGGAIASKNGIKKSLNQVAEAYSTMDIYLKKRHDLIPNLVNTVKGYAQHETETLQKILDAAAAASSANSIDQKVIDEEKLDNAMTTLLNMTRNMPELSSNVTYNNLLNQLQSIENDIANARKYYNASVREYNNKISTFPGSLVAGKEQPKAYFQVSNQAERQSIDVNF